MEVFLNVQEGGKLLKLATVVAVLENVSVLLFLEFCRHEFCVLETACYLFTNKPFFVPIS